MDSSGLILDGELVDGGPAASVPVPVVYPSVVTGRGGVRVDCSWCGPLDWTFGPLAGTAAFFAGRAHLAYFHPVAGA